MSKRNYYIIQSNIATDADSERILLVWTLAFTRQESWKKVGTIGQRTAAKAEGYKCIKVKLEVVK